MQERTQRPPRSARDQEIIALRQDGRTLQQIAEEFQLSRPRISQIVNATGGTHAGQRPERPQRHWAPARQATRLIGLDLEEHPGSSEIEVANRLGIDVADVRAHVPRSAKHLLLGDSRSGVSTWTRDDSLAALSLASTFEWPLSTTTYDALLRQGEIRGPSSVRLAQVFGSWRSACLEAGVESLVSHWEGHQSRRTRWRSG